MSRKVVLTMLAAVLSGFGQIRPENTHPPDEVDAKLPDGTSRREAILKADHEKSLRDADELVKLAQDLKTDLEKNDRHVLSIATLKRLDDIDKMTKRIRGRMKRM